MFVAAPRFPARGVLRAQARRSEGGVRTKSCPAFQVRGRMIERPDQTCRDFAPEVVSNRQMESTRRDEITSARMGRGRANTSTSDDDGILDVLATRIDSAVGRSSRGASHADRIRRGAI